MVRTPLLRSIRARLAELRAASQAGLELEALRDARASALERDSGAFGRRAFLGGAAAAAGGLLLPWASACEGDEVGYKGDPRIVIVGGGIAGLTAALTLRDGGYSSTVYEMSPTRVGGRMRSERASDGTNCGNCHQQPSIAKSMSWSDGQVTDIFGELIDSDHETIRALAERFHIPLVNSLENEAPGATETYFFGGQYYSPEDAQRDFEALLPVLLADNDAAGYPTTYDSSTAEGRALDAMTVRDWIKQRVPGGLSSPMGQLLDTAYTIEYGADTDQQSALNLVYLLGGAEEEFAVFGASDEAYRVIGGNDQIPRAIANELGMGTRVLLDWELLALRQEGDASYTLTFRSPRRVEDVRADVVILALPFATLRTLDYSKAGFDALKIRAIQEQGAGKNGKHQLQFRKRLWATEGPWGTSGGTTYSDTGFQLAWDPTRGQPGESGILAMYTGGSRAEACRITHPYGNWGDPNVVADARLFLQQLEPVFPGISAEWNGKVAATMAHKDRRFHGSYAYYKPGQTQTFAGYERVRQGSVFFAGEHTSLDYLGFMEGGASEGVAVATDVLMQLPRRIDENGFALRPAKKGRRARGRVARSIRAGRAR